jgi:nitroreductase
MAEIELREAMSTLRAVRRLKPDPIPEDALGRILDAATWAPTGGNAQPWRVIVVRDREKMAALGRLYAGRWHSYAKGHRELLAKAPEEVKASAEKMIGAGDHLADHFAETPVLLVFCFNPKSMAITDAKLDRISRGGGGSVYPAVQNTMLACREDGLGCTLTTLHCLRESQVMEPLDIPEGWATLAMVPIGYPVGGGHGPITRQPPSALAFDDAFGTPWI